MNNPPTIKGKGGSEYHISECCKADLFFKGAGKGFWCSKCKQEITHTIVAFTKKEIIALKKLRDKHNPMNLQQLQANKDTEV